MSHTMRRGYALLYILLAVAALAVVAAASAPLLLGVRDNDRATATWTTLKQLSTGVVSYSTTLIRTGATHQYPGALSQLTQQIATGNKTSCAIATETVNAADVTLWNANAPFVAIYTPTNGVMTPLGRIQDTIPTRTKVTGDVWIQIPNADGNDATLLDRLVDGGDGGTTGLVQFAAPVAGLTTIRYHAVLAGAGFNAC